jgi:DNA-binding NarL/FixJ family response regulator
MPYSLTCSWGAPARTSTPSRDCARRATGSSSTAAWAILYCLEFGATTYLTKNEGSPHLVAAIRAAATDRPYVGSAMAGAMSNPPSRAD